MLFRSVATSLIISAGFAVLLLAPFTPLIYFGGLTIVAVMMALICDLSLLPALIKILVTDKKDNK